MQRIVRSLRWNEPFGDQGPRNDASVGGNLQGRKACEHVSSFHGCRLITRADLFDDGVGDVQLNPRLDQPLPTQWFATTDVLRRMQINLEFQRQRIGDALERRDAEIPGRIFQRGGLLARHAEPPSELRL